MFDWELGETLSRVGKTRFVHNFDILRDYAKGEVTREEVIEKVRPSNDPRASIGHAKKIFDAKREADALWIIYQSVGVDHDTRDRARILHGAIANR